MARRYQDGEKIGERRPKCGSDLEFEMSFRDAFSHSTGHYTTDRALKVCRQCDFTDDFEPRENE